MTRVKGVTGEGKGMRRRVSIRLAAFAAAGTVVLALAGVAGGAPVKGGRTSSPR